MMRLILGALAIAMVFSIIPARGGEEDPVPPSLLERDTFTDNWFSLGRRLEEDTGISVGLGLTQVYQQNLTEGAAANTGGRIGGTHRRAGRYTGSYDLETEIDLETLISLPGGTVFMLTEGGWSDGLDDSSVGSLFGVNGDAMGDQAVQVSELWYQQNLLDGRLRFRVGKIDLTGGFDCRGAGVGFDGNAFANDETAQFLNGSMVNNPSIPFPDYALAAAVYVEPVDGLYVTVAGADAQADGRETGFNTAFHDEDYFFGIMETGVVTGIPAPWGALPGAYRVGMWYDPQDKDRFHGRSAKRDDVGFYLSFDQQFYRENDRDDQGLGGFFRYGWADRDVAEIRCFWSAGLQYTGPVPGRDADVLGAGYSNAKSGAIPGITAGREQAWEVYYAVEIAPWLHVTPHVQFIRTPGYTGDTDAAVVGARVQMNF